MKVDVSKIWKNILNSFNAVYCTVYTIFLNFYNINLIVLSGVIPQDQSEVIFEHDLMSGKLILKAGMAIHLFISTSPCGDGRIFAPNEQACADLVDRNAGRMSRGVLRTKIEGGEGKRSWTSAAESFVKMWRNMYRTIYIRRFLYGEYYTFLLQEQFRFRQRSASKLGTASWTGTSVCWRTRVRINYFVGTCSASRERYSRILCIP